MAVIRILVDGYSLLHAWPELAPGRSRFSAMARDELVHRLRLYRDAVGTPVTVVFDGANAQPEVSVEMASTPEMEIIFSRTGQTADQIIESVAARIQPYGQILVVTDDNAERDTVIGFGSHATSCDLFIADLKSILGDMERDLKHLNDRERRQFRKP